MASILYEYTPDQLQELLNSSYSYADLLRRIGLNEHGGNPKTLKRIIKEYGLDDSQLNQNRKKFYSACAQKANAIRKNKNGRTIDKIFENKIKPGNQVIIKHLVNEGYKDYKCEQCGLVEWLGKEITLQLHHEDGNKENNQLDNLKILCPNCHSQTDTFAGRNNKKNKKPPKFNKIPKSTVLSKINQTIKQKELCIICNNKLTYSKDKICDLCKKKIERRKDKYTIEEIIPLIENENMKFKEVADIYKLPVGLIINDYKKYKQVKNLNDIYVDREKLKYEIRNRSFLQIAKDYKVTDNAVRKWCDKYNLPRLKKDINKYTDEEWEKL